MMRHPEPSSGQPPDNRERLCTQPPHHVATPHQAIASHLPHLSNLGPGGLLPGGIAAAHPSSTGSNPGMHNGLGDSPNLLPDTTATAPVLHKPGQAPATPPQQQPGGSSSSGIIGSPLLPAQPAAAPAGPAAAASGAAKATSVGAQAQGGGPSGGGQALSGAAAGTQELLAAAVGLPENSLTAGPGSLSEQQQGCRQLGGGPATTLPASLLAAGIISAAQPDAQQTNNNPAALQDIHQQVALAAAKAGAIHHVGEPIARAVNIAEVALDPAHAVDFDCAQVTTRLPAATLIGAQTVLTQQEHQGSPTAMPHASETTQPDLPPLDHPSQPTAYALPQPQAPPSSLPLSYPHGPDLNTAGEAAAIAISNTAAGTAGTAGTAGQLGQASAAQHAQHEAAQHALQSHPSLAQVAAVVSDMVNDVLSTDGDSPVEEVEAAAQAAMGTGGRGIQVSEELLLRSAAAALLGPSPGGAGTGSSGGSRAATAAVVGFQPHPGAFIEGLLLEAGTGFDEGGPINIAQAAAQAGTERRERQAAELGEAPEPVSKPPAAAAAATTAAAQAPPSPGFGGHRERVAAAAPLVATSAEEIRWAHDSAARAAAVAGALVHMGQPIARAANLADTAVDPADAVDFDCARTNLPLADTVPDVVASRAARRAAAAGAGQAVMPSSSAAASFQPPVLPDMPGTPPAGRAAAPAAAQRASAHGGSSPAAAASTARSSGAELPASDPNPPGPVTAPAAALLSTDDAAQGERQARQAAASSGIRAVSSHMVQDAVAAVPEAAEALAEGASGAEAAALVAALDWDRAEQQAGGGGAGLPAGSGGGPEGSVAGGGGPGGRPAGMGMRAGEQGEGGDAGAACLPVGLLLAEENVSAAEVAQQVGEGAGGAGEAGAEMTADPELEALDRALEAAAHQPLLCRPQDLLPALGSAAAGSSQLAHARRHAVQAAAAAGRLLHHPQCGGRVARAVQEAEVATAPAEVVDASAGHGPGGDIVDRGGVVQAAAWGRGLVRRVPGPGSRMMGGGVGLAVVAEGEEGEEEAAEGEGLSGTGAGGGAEPSSPLVSSPLPAQLLPASPTDLPISPGLAPLDDLSLYQPLGTTPTTFAPGSTTIIGSSAAAAGAASSPTVLTDIPLGPDTASAPAVPLMAITSACEAEAMAQDTSAAAQEVLQPADFDPAAVAAHNRAARSSAAAAALHYVGLGVGEAVQVAEAAAGIEPAGAAEGDEPGGYAVASMG